MSFYAARSERKHAMQIRVSRFDWTDLGLDDNTRYQRAIAAFYCGHGPNYVRRLLDIGSAEEWDYIEDLATLLGMDRSVDSIIVF